MMTERDMFEKSFQRPWYFFEMCAERQWEVDKDLGILDWIGGNLSEEEMKRFQQHYKKPKK